MNSSAARCFLGTTPAPLPWMGAGQARPDRVRRVWAPLRRRCRAVHRALLANPTAGTLTAWLQAYRNLDAWSWWCSYALEPVTGPRTAPKMKRLSTAAWTLNQEMSQDAAPAVRRALTRAARRGVPATLLREVDTILSAATPPPRRRQEAVETMLEEEQTRLNRTSSTPLVLSVSVEQVRAIPELSVANLPVRAGRIHVRANDVITRLLTRSPDPAIRRAAFQASGAHQPTMPALDQWRAALATAACTRAGAHARALLDQQSSWLTPHAALLSRVRDTWPALAVHARAAMTDLAHRMGQSALQPEDLRHALMQGAEEGWPRQCFPAERVVSGAARQILGAAGVIDLRCQAGPHGQQRITGTASTTGMPVDILVKLGTQGERVSASLAEDEAQAAPLRTAHTLGGIIQIMVVNPDGLLGRQQVIALYHEMGHMAHLVTMAPFGTDFTHRTLPSDGIEIPSLLTERAADDRSLMDAIATRPLTAGEWQIITAAARTARLLALYIKGVRMLLNAAVMGAVNDTPSEMGRWILENLGWWDSLSGRRHLRAMAGHAALENDNVYMKGEWWAEALRQGHGDTSTAWSAAAPLLSRMGSRRIATTTWRAYRQITAKDDLRRGERLWWQAVTGSPPSPWKTTGENG